MRSLGKTLPVPSWPYARLERWHHVSFLKTRDTLNMLKNIAAQAEEPRQIEALLEIIEEDLGYELHQAVQALKYQLSNATEARFHFQHIDIDIRARVTRAQFESWIADELEEIRTCVDRVVRTAGIDRRDVDRVFLTGGTSFVPAVRQIFSERFGTDRIQTGGEFTSVARGLALRARDFARAQQVRA